eukprot:scaffold14002_cov43-Cyclotella_meneghiniana.AAC.2
MYYSDKLILLVHGQMKDLTTYLSSTVISKLHTIGQELSVKRPFNFLIWVEPNCNRANNYQQPTTNNRANNQEAIPP